MKKHYFDYNSTTPTDLRVQKIMSDTMQNYFGNPSSIHSRGRKAKELIEISRRQIADFIGASKNEIYFTSGGTESNNWVMKGMSPLFKAGKNHIITSITEHSSIFESARELERQGINVTYLPVDRDGKINPLDLQKSITDKTALISLMTANNETGVIQDMNSISAIAREKGILLHTDAVQAAGKMPVDVNSPEVDLLSLSSHKLYGPLGIGALYIRRGVSLSPLIHGGGQENSYRSGTENVPAITGFGEACRISGQNFNNDTKHFMHLKNILYRGLQEKIECTKLNGSFKDALPNTLNMSFPGCESETLVLDLDSSGFYLSSGSACGSIGRGKSRVLKAMALKPAEVFSSLRFSMGRETTEKEVLRLIEVLSELVGQFV